MTTDDVLDTISACHSLLKHVPLDECDDDHEAAVMNALDALDPVVIDDGRPREGVDGDGVKTSLAMLYETVHGLDWSAVPEVSDAEARAMSERLLAALEAMDEAKGD